MDKIQSQVKAFMERAGQTVRTKPSSIPQDEATLRVKLLIEEVFELAEASGVSIIGLKDDGSPIVAEDFLYLSMGVDEERLPDIADAIADISYVNYGAALAYGINMEPIEDFVQEANMAKFSEGSYRREDGKWMKPPDWTGPEEKIKQEINRQKDAK
jgi:predicted HAD superfamily Cof-like phosphohydrolase